MYFVEPSSHNICTSQEYCYFSLYVLRHTPGPVIILKTKDDKTYLYQSGSSSVEPRVLKLYVPIADIFICHCMLCIKDDRVIYILQIYNHEGESTNCLVVKGWWRALLN